MLSACHCVVLVLVFLDLTMVAEALAQLGSLCLTPGQGSVDLTMGEMDHSSIGSDFCDFF